MAAQHTPTQGVLATKAQLPCWTAKPGGFILVFRRGHLWHALRLHILAHAPGEKFPCGEGRAVPPGASCPTSSGLRGPGSQPCGQLGCPGLLPPQQQQQLPSAPARPSCQCDSIGHTPNAAVIPAAARAEQSTASAGQGRAGPGAISQAVGPGCARVPTAISPRTGRREDIRSLAGESSSPPLASSSPLWGQDQAVPASPRETSPPSGAGLEVPSLLPACLVQGSALIGALPLRAAEPRSAPSALEDRGTVLKDTCGLARPAHSPRFCPHPALRGVRAVPQGLRSPSSHSQDGPQEG